MVNLIATQRTLLHGLMKLAGVVQHTVEVEPGTTLNIWVPAETIKKPRKSTVTSKKCYESEDGDGMETCKPTKPVVVFLQAFFADGIYNWQFQVGSFTKNYSVYVPDLLFFGGSVTDNADRSPKFQADCLVKGLMKLGIERCAVVGLSYGGMVAFKMGEFYPELVEALVITGSTWSMTDTISSSMLEDFGSPSFSEILIPNSISGTRALLKLGAHMNFSWFPDRFHKDFLEVMFNNRKERAELLEGFQVRNEDAYIPNFQQRIHLLWGEYDQVFKLELAEKMKAELGSKTTLEEIKKAGHLVNIERPCKYTRCLKRFLASVHSHTHNASK